MHTCTHTPSKVSYEECCLISTLPFPLRHSYLSKSRILFLHLINVFWAFWASKCRCWHVAGVNLDLRVSRFPNWSNVLLHRSNCGVAFLCFSFFALSHPPRQATNFKTLIVEKATSNLHRKKVGHYTIVTNCIANSDNEIHCKCWPSAVAAAAAALIAM